ncbi:hypothetical protein ANS017_25950 [Paraclostridium bifermentans]|nr:hypothetical protein ANS015_04820 [Paraclostridium bifermentans]GKZ11211.1 hypothetical protein ANS017_25950 [Paraclostridium bifermentans]
MDKNLHWVCEKQIERTIKALESNNMNGYLVKSKEDLIKKNRRVSRRELFSCMWRFTNFIRNRSNRLFKKRKI